MLFINFKRMKQIIECVPNISEGRDNNKIARISSVVEEVDGVKLLNVDAGKATNRTVITFVGEPEQVIEAAFLLIKKAQELIDMTKHSGEHPRMGATDVCPLVPISNIDMKECVMWAKKLGERVGRELGIPGYYYEAAANKKERQNLANCRKGEYEGLSKKLVDPKWNPDFGPAVMISLGGTLIDILDEKLILMAPFLPSELQKKLKSLKSYKLLKGYRGSSEYSVKKLCEAASKISYLALDFNKYIDEIDINPIIILEDKAIAVDNVFILKKIKINLLS